MNANSSHSADASWALSAGGEVPVGVVCAEWR